ncbi:hypothetical protein AVEN_142341-1 [Araneus ventricosus]|uniref:Uncharacterized protein n=1 Tax=Araneus ventricosus TaxID=182803 RepID=A0A4Y2G919_ARAVE|nr:hypothetical protein AVEN_142341-1 [Araneus ventricosus]
MFARLRGKNALKFLRTLESLSYCQIFKKNSLLPPLSRTVEFHQKFLVIPFTWPVSDANNYDWLWTVLNGGKERATVCPPRELFSQNCLVDVGRHRNRLSWEDSITSK